MADYDPQDLIDINEVCREVGGAETPVAKATVWRMVNDDRLPPPLELGSQLRRWLRPEIRARIKARIAARDAERAS